MARLEHYRDLHEQFSKILEKNLGKEPYLMMKTAEIKHNVQIELRHLVEKGGPARIF